MYNLRIWTIKTPNSRLEISIYSWVPKRKRTYKCTCIISSNGIKFHFQRKNYILLLDLQHRHIFFQYPLLWTIKLSDLKTWRGFIARNNKPFSTTELYNREAQIQTELVDWLSTIYQIVFNCVKVKKNNFLNTWFSCLVL